MKTPMMRGSLVLVILPITLILLLSTMGAQAQEVLRPNEPSDDCKKKTETECVDYHNRAKDITWDPLMPEKDIPKACCGAVGYSRCVYSAVADHCPGKAAYYITSELMIYKAG